MDFDKALTLLKVIHASVGIPEATSIRVAAIAELETLDPVKPSTPEPIDQFKFDLAGKPIDKEPKS